MGLIKDAGYAPIDVGRNEDAAVMEMPRRDPVPSTARSTGCRTPRRWSRRSAAGDEIPPTPSYS